MSSKHLYFQFIIGTIFGSVIACSPTKFSKNEQIASICDASVANCVTGSGSTDVTQSYKIGSGKVDILFVSDNSASMSKVQIQLATKFSGFIQSLDAKSIDYRIAIITTDLSSVLQNKLLSFGNGKKFITSADADRVDLFNNTIIRSETIGCENFIITMFNTFGTSFQTSAPGYEQQYKLRCPSPDTRGIYTANVVVSENSSEFVRSDANLNIILISNDDVRQGKEGIVLGRALEEKDKAAAFVSMMQQNYPNKYWDFNSIIVKDNVCKQSQTLYNAIGQLVVSGNKPAINGGLGIEYANLSNSAARDLDNNPRPRGQILDICQSDYARNFSSMSTQIAQDARAFTMRCTPSAEPTVSVVGNPEESISYSWNGDKVVFTKADEGKSVTISYSCYTGPT